ncbi:MAG: hypothetical protein JWQ50_7291 [Caballeronia mineralivorans]|nr:hypothetical protein [Caballeronia mineralivorans]MEA3100159.1 hypothetical protein [Caballeronia mineralivorans]
MVCAILHGRRDAAHEMVRIKLSAQLASVLSTFLLDAHYCHRLSSHAQRSDKNLWTDERLRDIGVNQITSGGSESCRHPSARFVRSRGYSSCRAIAACSSGDLLSQRR